MAILMGLFPTFFLAPTAPAIDKLVDRIVQTRQLNVDAVAPGVGHSASDPRNPIRQSSIANRQ
jgi:hypothetical protein